MKDFDKYLKFGKRARLKFGEVSYLSSITSHLLNMFHWMVFDLFFYCVTVKTIYREIINNRCDMQWLILLVTGLSICPLDLDFEVILTPITVSFSVSNTITKQQIPKPWGNYLPCSFLFLFWMEKVNLRWVAKSYQRTQTFSLRKDTQNL